MPNVHSKDSGQLIVRLPERTRRALNSVVRHKNERTPGAKFSANSIIRMLIKDYLSSYIKNNPEITDLILEDAKSRIMRGEFKGVAHDKLWGGAGVIVLTNTAESYKEQEESRNGFYGHNDIYVFSDHAAEISALFYELRDTCAGEIDSANKYEFYGRIAKAANEQIKKADNVTDVLLAMLRVVGDMRKEGWQ